MIQFYLYQVDSKIDYCYQKFYQIKLEILDEPTNDLDLETMDLLTEMLANYKGTLLIVSHDKIF